MADIALSDYLAYLFQEITTARRMADRHSKEVALAYAKDDVLRHFPVPRFKIAKMSLDMPVYVSAVQASSLAAAFQMPADEFRKMITGAVTDLVIAIQKSVTPRPKPLRIEGVDADNDALYRQLGNASAPGWPDAIVKPHLTKLVQRLLEQNELPASLERGIAAELFTRTVGELTETIRGKAQITRAAVESLLVNPETNVIRNGAAGAPLLTIKAELMEEGLFVKSMRDETTGKESPVVEFE